PPTSANNVGHPPHPVPSRTALLLKKRQGPQHGVHRRRSRTASHRQRRHGFPYTQHPRRGRIQQGCSSLGIPEGPIPPVVDSHPNQSILASVTTHEDWCVGGPASDPWG